MNEFVATPPAEGAPAFPDDRTCPYQIPDGYKELRDEADSLQKVTLFDGREAWVVTKYDTARKLLTDPRLSADRTREGFPVTSARGAGIRQRRPAFNTMDPPEHGPKRRMLISEFAVRRIKGMRADIEQIVHGFIDDMLAAGPTADLVCRFARPVASQVICRLLGVSRSDHEFFQDADKRFTQSTSAEESLRVRDDLARYVEGLVTEIQKKPEPGSGLLDGLVARQLEAGGTDREELVSSVLLLLAAGHEPSASMTSLGVITLLEHPEQQAALREDPSLIPGAVEELLRYLAIAPDNGFGRVATADIEIDGHLLRAGDGIIVSNSIANRDGSVFEDPDTFDVHRSARHHIAFGYGVHQCLGQNLARLELEIILTALLDRIPTLRLAVPVEELTLRPGAALQGVNELPVTW